MSFEYNITYSAENTYETVLDEAFWQFLIFPKVNNTQEIVEWHFENSALAPYNLSINGLGFTTIQLRSQKKIKTIGFSAFFKVLKKEVNPFESAKIPNTTENYKLINSLDFRVNFEPYLRKTKFTTLPKKHNDIFRFDISKPIFENLQQLNHWIYIHLYFKTNVTDVDTTLQDIIDNRHGVCQDFSHLFCAIARENGIPTRYVSGYLHQGNGYFGDSQMHAWVETYVPELGWVGFDPTNNILANHNHVKVAHGKDFNDCSALRGVVYTGGKNTTKYSVEVLTTEQ